MELMDVNQINAPHKFERKKLGKNVKCFVCNSLIWSSGCACSLCDIPVHKACAVKARKENCPVLEKELSEALSAPSGLDSPAQNLKIGMVGKRESKPTLLPHLPTLTSSSQEWNPYTSSPINIPSSPSLNGGGLEIFLSDGTSKTINYTPDTILLNVINQIREEKDIDGPYIVYDRAGKIISNFDQSLKKVKTNFPLFFTSVENTSKSSGKKSKLRLSSKRKARIGQTQEINKSTATSPQLSTKHRSKSILGPKKSGKKASLYKDIPEPFEQRHGTMSITVISVADLANQTSAYKLLYFTLTHLDNNQRHRSKLLENNATPTWNQTIKFHMPCAIGQWNIKIWAIQKIDTNAADILLGEANFVLKNFRDGDSETKTLVVRKEDIHKKEKKVKRVQLDFLQLENQQLRQEIEDERRQRESLRIKLEDVQKQMTQLHDAHTEEMKTIKNKFQRELTTKNHSEQTNVILVMQEEIEALKKELQDMRIELQQARTREEELRKSYEEQIEFFKTQAESGKSKNPKILIQWSYQDRKLKTNVQTVVHSGEGGTKRTEWTPSKSRIKSNRIEALAGGQKSFLFRQYKLPEDECEKSTQPTLPEIPPTLHLIEEKRPEKKREYKMLTS